MKLTNARVLLTGASGGIGTAIARELVAGGARVALAGRRRVVLAELAATLEGETHPVCGDLAEAGGRQTVVAEALRALGGIDLLINVAGVLEFVPFVEQTPEAIERIVATNAVGPMLLTRELLPHLLAQGSGRIVNVGSTFGSIAFAYFAAYSASKFALRGFSEALRRELDGSGVGVTYVAPRATRTAINNSAVMRMGEAVGMNMDEPVAVARAVVRAIERERDEAYIGWPESLFVRINALLPRLVDGALRKQNRIAAGFAAPERQDGRARTVAAEQ